jgi:hypothetical protein
MGDREEEGGGEGEFKVQNTTSGSSASVSKISFDAEELR